MTGRERYADMRSILEVPILNDRFWSKVPNVEADAIMIDLEDAAAPQDKERVRDRMLRALSEPEYFGGRRVIVRVNNLSTPWATDDLLALRNAPMRPLVCYPKVQSVSELEEVDRILGSAGSHELYVMIETARGMSRMREIAAHPSVVGLHFGYVDYAADVGVRVFDDSEAELFSPAYSYTQAKIALVAAAGGLFSTGGTLIPNYHDLAKVERFVRRWSELGYTGCIAVSPNHLGLINRLMRPSEDELATARVVCDAYLDATARGEPAAFVSGKIITLPDYRVAALTLAKGGFRLGVEADLIP